MLLVLSASKRQSELRAIDLRFKKCTLEWVSFQLAAMTKTGTATKSMEFFFPSFPHNKRLCPVTCLDSYVEGTSAWRVVGDGPQPLFLAIQGPHKAVSSATIGRWLKDKMKEAGIDVDTFKAHSTKEQPAQLPGTEVSLSRISYKQLIGQGKQHSIVSTTAPNILIILAKQSLMVRASFKGTN